MNYNGILFRNKMNNMAYICTPDPQETHRYDVWYCVWQLSESGRFVYRSIWSELSMNEMLGSGRYEIEGRYPICRNTIS